MSGLEVLAILIAFIVIIIVVLPFVIVKNVRLSESVYASSFEELKHKKQLLLEQYIEFEAMWKKKEINNWIWSDRASLIMKRYIDVVRRLDQLKQSEN